jgi:MHS family alpha-ketoglutarate permease-like MFS transporter
MSLTVALAAVGSLVIGLSPNYAAIGIGASIVLVLAGWPRAWPTAVSCRRRRPTSPRRPEERRGLWSTLIYFSGTIGSSRGPCWRRPVHVAVPGGDERLRLARPVRPGRRLRLYALYMRLRMHETDVFVDEATQDDPAPTGAARPPTKKGAIWQTVKEHPSCCSRSSA